MSKSGQRKRSAQGSKSARARPRHAPDGVYYGGFLLIGLFTAALWFIAAQQTWRWSLVVCVGLFVTGVNLYGVRAYRGRRLANWQAAMARVPLRFTEFGRQGGRSLEAAHDQPAVRSALSICALLSVLVVAGLVYWAVTA